MSVTTHMKKKQLLGARWTKTLVRWGSSSQVENAAWNHYQVEWQHGETHLSMLEKLPRKGVDLFGYSRNSGSLIIPNLQSTVSKTLTARAPGGAHTLCHATPDPRGHIGPITFLKYQAIFRFVRHLNGEESLYNCKNSSYPDPYSDLHEHQINLLCSNTQPLHPVVEFRSIRWKMIIFQIEIDFRTLTLSWHLTSNRVGFPIQWCNMQILFKFKSIKWKLIVFQIQFDDFRSLILSWPLTSK